MRERGIGLSSAKPKKLDADIVRVSDVVITMGGGDDCPIVPGRRYEDWELEDPAGKDVDRVREVRDDIDVRVRQLVTSLLPERVQRA